MEAVDALPVLRLASAIIVLGYASILDWRTRRVGNVYWLALAAVGLALMVLQVILDEQNAAYLLVMVPVLAVLADVYWDSEGGGVLSKLSPAIKYAVAILAMVILGAYWANDEYFLFLLAVPAMMIFIVLMYMLDVIRGGADAKALLAITVLFPFHPYLDSLPFLRPESTTTEIFFPFSLVVLFNAAVLVALLPLVFLARNTAAGNLRFPQALLGYRMSLDGIEGKFVWLMERVEGGGHVLYTRPRRFEDLRHEVELLKAAGASEAWVTPKMPFLIPITVSLCLSAVVGNLLLLILQI